MKQFEQFEWGEIVFQPLNGERFSSCDDDGGNGINGKNSSGCNRKEARRMVMDEESVTET